MKNKLATENLEITKREKAHNEIVRNAAVEGMVLLKNNGVLPFDKSIKTVALYGIGARRTVKGGTGSGDVNVRSYVDVEEGLENAGYEVVTKPYLDEYDRIINEAKIEYEKMLQEKGKEGVKTALFTMFANPFKEPAISEITAEDSQKYTADAAIYVLSRNSGEGADRKAEKGDYYLTDGEIRDITRLSNSYKKFVLLLNVGGVIDLGEIVNNSKIGSILLISQGGSSLGDAVADVISGKGVPSGKLSATWAKSYLDYPFAEDFSDEKYFSDTYYKEGIFVGYRYFEKKQIKPLFPFGFGLSYTDFEISDTKITANEEHISVSTKVKNIGKTYGGKEVIQLYVSQPQEGLVTPVKSLVAFAKTKTLLPGEEQSVTITFDMKSLAVFDEETASYIIKRGRYIVYIGTDSENSKKVHNLIVSDDIITEKCKRITYSSIEETCDFHDNAEMRFDELPTIALDLKNIKTLSHIYDDKTESIKSTNLGYTLDDVKVKKISINDFVCDLNVNELISLCVGASRIGLSDLSFIGNASKSIPGAAGDTCDELLEKRKIRPLSTVDGPAGIRINSKVYEKDGLYVDNPADDPIKSLLLPKEMQKADLNGTTVKYQFCTAMPIATMLCQTWNTEIIENCGKLVSKEMGELGLDLWLAPALNIQRNPLCGRNFEYYSEDPILSGKCAAAMVNGFQKSGKGAVIKHFACNNKENNRNYNNSVLSERALREIYLKGFEICVKESQPFAVMSSYNLINGTHSANHRGILTDVLRTEWGFNGVVMTDWYATTGKTADEKSYGASGAADCIRAGNDIIMPGGKNEIESITKEAESGELSVASLRLCAERIIKAILKMG